MGLAVVDDIGEEIGGQGLGGMTGIGGWMGGGVGEQKTDNRDRWGWAARNSSVVGMLFSSFSEESRFQVRMLVVHCWGTVVSSLSSSKGKTSDGWFEGVLGRDSGCEGSCQLRLFKMEMVVVHKGTAPVDQARSFVTLGPG